MYIIAFIFGYFQIRKSAMEAKVCKKEKIKPFFLNKNIILGQEMRVEKSSKTVSFLQKQSKLDPKQTNNTQIKRLKKLSELPKP